MRKIIVTPLLILIYALLPIVIGPVSGIPISVFLALLLLVSGFVGYCFVSHIQFLSWTYLLLLVSLLAFLVAQRVVFFGDITNMILTEGILIDYFAVILDQPFTPFSLNFYSGIILLFAGGKIYVNLEPYESKKERFSNALQSLQRCLKRTIQLILIIIFSIMTWFLLAPGGQFHFFSIPVGAFFLTLVILIEILWAIGEEGNQQTEVICRLKGKTWIKDEFCRGWGIFGETGSGKTSSAYLNIINELFKYESNWGGISLDAKGNFYELLEKTAAHHNAREKIIVFKVGDKSSLKFNLLSYPLPWTTYAKMIVDTASSMGQKNMESFFKEQAQGHISKCMELIDQLGEIVTLKRIYNILTDKLILEEYLSRLEIISETSKEIREHFQSKFLNQPEKQLSGVMSLIYNYLRHFALPEIAEVFCSEKSDIKFETIDDGKVIALTIPQRFQEERRYISTFFKFLYYNHALNRLSKSKYARKNENLLVLFGDEAQGIVTNSESGYSDHSVIDRIRETGATVIFGAQSPSSFYPVLGKDATRVLLVNLANKILYRAGEAQDAQDFADIFGKEEKTVYEGKAGGKAHYSKKEVWRVNPNDFLKFKDFECVIKHCRKGFQKTKLLPPFETRD